MTCREKLKLEYPEDVNPDFVGGCRDCPCTYGYLGDSDECDGGRRDETCRKCWDREIPDTKPLELGQDDDPFTAILKPCPFCGGHAVLRRGNKNKNGYYVTCTKCGARSQFHDLKYTNRKDNARYAVNDWNRRV